MAAYYNEIDPVAATWLRELIKEGLIADGEVDERSIEDVSPNELTGFVQIHMFAGIGCWSYALRLAGWPDDKEVATASCPCQPFSLAGEGKGFDDERHLWPACHWILKERRPNVVFGEQVASKSGRAWLDLVSTDMEGEGFAIGSASTVACGFGAPHKRQRTYWVADSEWDEQPRKESRRREIGRMGRIEQPVSWDEPWESALRRLRALDDGNSYGVSVTDCVRNAIVPQQAQAFIESYMEIKH